MGDLQIPEHAANISFSLRDRLNAIEEASRTTPTRCGEMHLIKV